MHLTISTTDGARTSRHVEYDFNEEDDVQAPDAFDKRGFANLLDLIVLKIGAIVSEDRDPKKIPQDEQDLKQLVIRQNDTMKSRTRPLNAG